MADDEHHGQRQPHCIRRRTAPEMTSTSANPISTSPPASPQTTPLTSPQTAAPPAGVTPAAAPPAGAPPAGAPPAAARTSRTVSVVALVLALVAAAFSAVVWWADAYLVRGVYEPHDVFVLIALLVAIPVHLAAAVVSLILGVYVVIRHCRSRPASRGFPRDPAIAAASIVVSVLVLALLAGRIGW